MNNPEKEDKNNSEDLKNSEGEYQEIFNNLDVGYYKAKLDGTIIEHNTAVNIIGGYDPSEEFVGVKTRGFWFYAKEKEKYMELLMNNGFVKNYIVHVTTPKGENLALLTNSHIVRDQFDNPLYIEGTFVKVREEYNYAQKLKESEEYFRELFENMSSGVAVYEVQENGKKFILKNINKSGERISQVKREEIIGKDVVEIFPGFIEFGLYEVFQKVWKTGNPEKYSPKLYKDNRISHWAENYVCKLLSGDIVAIYDDITEQRNAEERLKKSEERLKKLNIELELRIEERTKELKESEEKYRLISENASDLIAILNSKLEHEYINEEAYLKFLGYTKDELIGKKPWDLIHPEDLSSFENLDYTINHGIEGLIPEFKEELRLRHKDGHYIWVESINKVFTSSNGESKIFAVSRDISDRKEAELQLKESEEKYRNLIEQSKDAIFKVSLDNKIIYANPACFNIYGYTPEEFMSDPSLSERILHPDYKQPFIDFWQQYYLNKKFPEHSTEWGWIRKDGEIVYTENIFTNIMDDQGNITGFQTVARDITERKKVEEALIIKDNAINSSINAIAIADLEGYLTYVNPSFLRMWRYKSEKEVLGKLNTIFWQAKEKAAEVVQALREKEGWIGELVAKRKDGSIFDVQLTSSMVIDKSGKPICMIATFIDISESKKAQLQLKESEVKYRKAYNQANFYKDLFAHDMYNILQNILSSSELCKLYLEYDKSQDRVDEVLEIISDQVKKGSNLIFKVQKLSDIEETQIPIETKDACKFLKDSIDFVKESYQKKDLNIQIDSFSKKISVQANDLLFDVFENILINGIRHNINSKIDLFIKISEERRKGVNYIKFEFKDNGIGIKNDHKEIIFQRDGNRDKSARGMGLGLSLVKKIIDSYSGKIWVEGRIKGDYTKGSNFILLIPRAA